MLREHDGTQCKTYHSLDALITSISEELVRELYREHGDSTNLRNVCNTAHITRCLYPKAGSTFKKFLGNIVLRNSALKLVM